MVPLIPVAIAVVGGGWLWKKAKHRGETPARRRIYEEALRSLKDPVKLRILADTYEKYGCKDWANMLRKRAALIELPAEHKVARKQAFRDALKSGDPAKVQKLAEAFHAQGASGSAAKLYEHAAALRQIIAEQAKAPAPAPQQKVGEEDSEDDPEAKLQQDAQQFTETEAEEAVADLDAEDAGDAKTEGGALDSKEEIIDTEGEGEEHHAST